MGCLIRKYHIWSLLWALLWALFSFAFVATVQAETEDPKVPGHEEIACPTCHENVFQAGDRGNWQDTSVTSRCIDCHVLSRTVPHEQLLFPAADQDDCTVCHRFHAPQQVLIPGGEWTIQAAGTAGVGHCRSCHGPGADLTSLSPGHRAAAELYHLQGEALAELTPSASCLFCHAGSGEGSWLAAAGNHCPAVNRHASHPVGVKVVSSRGGRDIDQRLPLFDQRMHCQTCHQLSAGTEDLLIAFPAPYDLCLGCHQKGYQAKDPLS